MPTDHPVFRLGKLAAVEDKRNLKLASIVRKIAVPAAYSIDEKFPGIQLQMLDNDRYGNCVVCEEYNHLQHFKLIETGKVVPITAREVDAEYFLETGNQDIGLELLPNLKRERTVGVMMAGKIRKIDAFAQVNPKDANAVNAAIFANGGLKIGLRLPISAQAEINAGRPWTKTTGAGTIPGTWGGHSVYVQGYDAKYVTCITWGRVQQMARPWFSKYCDEAYVLFDHLDAVKTRKLVDVKQVRAFLETL